MKTKATDVNILTGDKELVVKGRLYYRVTRSADFLLPHIIRVKAIYFWRTPTLGAGAHFSTFPGSFSIGPELVRRTIFKDFDKAKAKVMQLAKTSRKKFNKAFNDLEATTKQSLRNEPCNKES